MKMFSSMPNDEMIDFWIKNSYNVLFHGKHGVGKTSMILDGFKRNNIKYLQFSAATMDPWVDFVGVPKEVTDEKGSYLELVRPKVFRDNEIQALFFDEFNRSHKKVRNAVMELIQFKSINGLKFPNLRMIWGAVNPDEDSELKYDVEKLDPAQEDRFHIHIEIPYKPHAPYFVNKYGKDMSQAAIDWWDRLPKEVKNDVSPRRLEYAIEVFKADGNLMHVLPANSNANKLSYSLKNGSPLRAFKALVEEGNNEKIKVWLENENNYDSVRLDLLKNPEQFLKFLPEEKICSLASIDNKVSNYIFENYKLFQKSIEVLANSSQNIKLQKLAKNCIKNFTQQSNSKTVYINKPSVAASIAKHCSNMKNYRWKDLPFTEFKFKRHLYKLNTNIAELIGLIKGNPKQTNEKLRILNSIIQIVYNNIHTHNLNEEDAKNALHIIDWVINKTQAKNVINNVECFIPTINTCVGIIRNMDKKYLPTDFITSYPSICGKLIYKTHFNDWCIKQ